MTRRNAGIGNTSPAKKICRKALRSRRSSAPFSSSSRNAVGTEYQEVMRSAARILLSDDGKRTNTSSKINTDAPTRKVV